MPRDRPLWAFHIIEGLQSGDLALYTKVHHATLDGAAGVAFAQALLDLTPKPRKVASAPRRSGEHPSLADLVGAAVRTTGVQGVKVIRQLPQLAAALASLVKGGGAGFGRNLAFGPRTAFNGQIDAARSFATASLPLDRVKRVAAAHGATINEVVLTVIGGALRRYLAVHGGVPRKSLIAAVPVSLREAGNTEATTLATMTLASLATDVGDPVARLVEVRAASAAAKAVMKQLRGAMPTDFPSLGLPWLLSAAAGLYGRLGVANRIPPIANLVVSNVPGPPMPFYLAGARLKTYWPVSIVEHGLGLNITLQSYAGSLDFGLIAARSVLPDLHRVARGLLEAFAELEAAPPPVSQPESKGPAPA
jgi:WS/DGAT/MGAT family acyltransferase